MAAGLKRDPIVILRIDGEDLLEFLKSPSFESEVLSIFSEIELPNASVQDYIIKALEKLTVEQGVPPASDSWVRSQSSPVIVFPYEFPVLMEPCLASVNSSSFKYLDHFYCCTPCKTFVSIVMCDT